MYVGVIRGKLTDCTVYFWFQIPLKTTVGITYGPSNGVHLAVVSRTHAL